MSREIFYSSLSGYHYLTLPEPLTHKKPQPPPLDETINCDLPDFPPLNLPTPPQSPPPAPLPSLDPFSIHDLPEDYVTSCAVGSWLLVVTSTKLICYSSNFEELSFAEFNCSEIPLIKVFPDLISIIVKNNTFLSKINDGVINRVDLKELKNLEIIQVFDFCCFGFYLILTNNSIIVLNQKNRVTLIDKKVM
ncbi:hypothetical protein P9112_000374 [Eukaryota sp. TZLM1-RC]